MLSMVGRIWNRDGPHVARGLRATVLDNQYYTRLKNYEWDLLYLSS